MADEIIDYGEWTLPTRWEDVTLKQYQEIERYYSDKDKKFDLREVLEIFTNHTRDEINELPLEFLEDIMENLKFLQTTPEDKGTSNTVIVGGEKYIVNTQNKLKVGEYIAADTALKGDQHNYAALLAVLCRKEDELYDSKFENEVLEDRIKMWEQVPVLDVLPLIGFFLQSYIASQTPSHLSSMVREAISLTRSNIESLHRDGEISKPYMKYVMRKLKKWEKSINSM